MIDFPKALKKSSYVLRALTVGVSELRWYGAFATGTSRRGSWRSLCKPPIVKCRSAVERGGGTYRPKSRAYFSGQAEETLQHLWVGCPSLVPLFTSLEQWLAGYGRVLDNSVFIYGFVYGLSRLRWQTCGECEGGPRRWHWLRCERALLTYTGGTNGNTANKTKPKLGMANQTNLNRRLWRNAGKEQ